MNNFADNKNGMANLHNINGDFRPEQTIVIVNVADIVREICQGVAAAVEQSNRSVAPIAELKPSRDSNPLGLNQPKMLSFSEGNYVGVFGTNGYGVYDDLGKLDKAKQYICECREQKFNDYNSAIDWAKRNIERISGIPMTRLQDTMNWFKYIK